MRCVQCVCVDVCVFVCMCMCTCVWLWFVTCSRACVCGLCRAVVHAGGSARVDQGSAQSPGSAHSPAHRHIHQSNHPGACVCVRMPVRARVPVSEGCWCVAVYVGGSFCCSSKHLRAHVHVLVRIVVEVSVSCMYLSTLCWGSTGGRGCIGAVSRAARDDVIQGCHKGRPSPAAQAAHIPTRQQAGQALTVSSSLHVLYVA